MNNYLTGIVATAVVTLASAGCVNRNTVSERSDDIIATDSIIWCDSVESLRSSAVCYIDVEYPEGNLPVVDSIRHWIASELSTNGYGSSDMAQYKPDMSLLKDGKAFVARAGRQVLNSTLDDMKMFDDEPELSISYEYLWNIMKMYETDSFVTYACSTYAYEGGAHGASSFAGQVFRMSDGSRLGLNEIFTPDAMPTLRQMLKNGIHDACFGEMSYNEFRDELFVDPDTMPLPVSQPYFVDDGIMFDYMQYEIAPYSAGILSCVLPYKAVKELMTTEAAGLIGD